MTVTSKLPTMSSHRSDRRKYARRYPVGAEVSEDGVHFRVWAPSTEKVIVQLGADVSMTTSSEFELSAEADGYHSGLIAEAKPGMHYRFQLKNGAFPDPASRFQPSGPHGPSRIIDSTAFAWTDQGWRGVGRRGQVI